MVDLPTARGSPANDFGRNTHTNYPRREKFVNPHFTLEILIKTIFYRQTQAFRVLS